MFESYRTRDYIYTQLRGTYISESHFVSLDAGKDKEVIANLQKVLEEQDRTLTEQGQALDERQNEIETLTTELQVWQEKCALTTRELEKKKEEISGVKKQAFVASDEKKRLESQMKDMSSKQESTEQNANVRLMQMEEEIRKMKQDRSCLEAQLRKRDEEIRKAHDSRENIVKTMHEAFEVAKANKAEYEIKLATVREQCRQDLKREMDEELRRTKRDFQRQLNDKDKSLEEIKNEKESVEKALAAERSEASKTDSSASVKRNYYNDVNFYVVERHLGKVSIDYNTAKPLLWDTGDAYQLAKQFGYLG